MSDQERQDERNEAVEDLDVQDEQAADVAGGTYQTGGSGGEDRLTENVTLNRK